MQMYGADTVDSPPPRSWLADVGQQLALLTLFPRGGWLPIDGHSLQIQPQRFSVNGSDDRLEGSSADSRAGPD